MTLQIGMLLFPKLTQLDLTAPLEVFHRIPDAKVHLVWKTAGRDGLVHSESGLGIAPTTSIDDCPPLDLVFIPGGSGQMAVMEDAAVLRFVREQGTRARWVTSVCTGAFVLGAAGLLEGYAATTHWAFRDLLPLVGARPADGRVVVDRNRITAGGVTAGIDFALRVVAEIAGERRAKEIALELEYDPDPPFRSGHPSVAEPDVVETVRARFAERFRKRQDQIRRVVAPAAEVGRA
jgi:cyclohexyl-isocyanide hydratase